MMTGRVSTLISVKSGLIESIMTRTPIIVHTDVMNCVRLCCSVFAIVSRSFVTRLITSPVRFACRSSSMVGDEVFFVHVLAHVVHDFLRDV